MNKATISSYVWWVSSDILEYGTWTQSRSRAERIKENLIKAGGVDAKIEYCK